MTDGPPGGGWVARVRFTYLSRDADGFTTYAAIIDGVRVAEIEGQDHTWTVAYAGGGIIVTSLGAARAWVERHASAIKAGEPVVE